MADKIVLPLKIMFLSCVGQHARALHGGSVDGPLTFVSFHDTTLKSLKFKAQNHTNLS